MFGEQVPEGRESPFAPGPRHGPEWCSQEVGIGEAKAGGKRVVVEHVSEVGRGLVMQGFVSEEEDFELWDRESMEVLEDGGNVITGARWVSR